MAEPGRRVSRMPDREPPMPPTGDYMDPDAGWSAYEEMQRPSGIRSRRRSPFHEQILAAAFKVLLQ